MGACSSCEAAAVTVSVDVTDASTAKVISMDGQLQEFAGLTRAAQAAKAIAAACGGGEPCFLCSADELELGSAVAAVAADEELQPGQLYFVLPATMLRRQLRAEEMAALAVKASAALVVAHKGPLVFPAMGEGSKISGGRQKARRSRSGSSRGRDFIPDLGAIDE